MIEIVHFDGEIVWAGYLENAWGTQRISSKGIRDLHECKHVKELRLKLIKLGVIE